MRCVVIVINRIIQKYTCTAAVIARSEATWQSPGREDGRGVHEQNTRPRRLAGPLACGGSPPRKPRGRNGTLRTRASQMPARAPCRASQMPARAPCRAGPLAGRGSLPFYRNSSERRDSTLGARKSAFTAPSSRTIAREAT